MFLTLWRYQYPGRSVPESIRVQPNLALQSNVGFLEVPGNSLEVLRGYTNIRL